MAHLRLGLTGGIGSGKSTVARLLAEHGAHLIDADDIARRCTLPGGDAIASIARHFGEAFIDADGGMNRTRMREHVFARPEAKRELEAIIHPLVQQEITRQYRESDAACTVFDIPLLVESPRWREQLDRVLVVDCTNETQIQRVMARNGWPGEQVQAVMRQQCSREQRRAAADIVLYNDGIDLTELRMMVRQVLPRLGL
ncbi:dephospho-CoA kinase [Hydrogenophaga sp.]|uniref:dephospho-CoA kinase n=1 Tax=Hydrogenophaga sp. TaxID=1904254 RepID=UPI0035B4069B